MKALFYYLIFPGFMFSAVAGLMAAWLDRKITARLQWRQGPPWYQNFADIIKLLGKETIVPGSAKATFLSAPYLGVLALTLLVTILGLSIIFPQQSFFGDIIVVLYLSAIPAICVIIGASSSRNPLASVGASREMKMMLSYELPFILTIITVIVKSGGAIRLKDIIAYQSTTASFLCSFSGAVAFVVALICIQAKLGLVPFDAAEADQEIMSGTLIEYSGAPLAVFKLMKSLMLYAMPLFLIVLFIANDLSPLLILGKFILIFLFIVLVKNTNPRLRIDQAMRFFWGPVTVLAIAALGLAMIGK